jgi:hypothetical protein
MFRKNVVVILMQISPILRCSLDELCVLPLPTAIIDKTPRIAKITGVRVSGHFLIFCVSWLSKGPVADEQEDVNGYEEE